MINHPRLLCLLCALAMWALARMGAALRHYLRKSDDEPVRENLGLVVSATLTLLGLIIGFTFSMATTRYDQRKLYEEQEANAIGTEYVRADLVPPNEAAAMKTLLAEYLDRRISFYEADYGALTPIDSETLTLQAQLWGSIKPQAAAQPTPVTALVVAGMNDVLNSQGYTQFAWWNRIPTAAWGLMIAIALCANLLVGYATRPSSEGSLLLLVLPVVVSVSFLLVADIDSPRGGIIRVAPQNLHALADSLHRSPK